MCALALAGCGGQGGVPAHPPARRTTTAAHLAVQRNKSEAGPVALSYRPLYDLAAPVQDPASASLGAGRFALLGGLTAADTSTDNVIVGDLRRSSVETALPNPQHDAQATAFGGQVYVFGGGQYSEYDHILAYDPATNSVHSAGTLPRAASDVAVTGDGSTGYVIGGFDGVNWLNTVLAFSPGRAARVIARLPVALRYAAATVVGGDVLVAGGSTPTGVSDGVYRIDPATGAVTTLGRLPSGITHAGAGVIGSTMYLVGGRGDLVSDRSADVWAIDASSGQIRRVARLPEPVSDAAVVSLGDRLIVAGGAAAGGTQAAVGELVRAGA